MGDTSRIRVFLEDGAVTLAGTYQFEFPVMMQPEIPRINVWHLCLCGDRSCRQPGDESIIVCFPMAGFNLYEVATQIEDEDVDFSLECATYSALLLLAMLVCLMMDL